MDHVHCTDCRTADDIRSYCLICRKDYCNRCTDLHAIHTMSRNHCIIYLSSGEIRNPPAKMFCDVCRVGIDGFASIYICIVCKEIQCDECNLSHAKEHKIKKIVMQRKNSQTKTDTQLVSTNPMIPTFAHSVETELSSDFDGTLHIYHPDDCIRRAQAPINEGNSNAISATVSNPGVEISETTTNETQSDKMLHNITYHNEFKITTDLEEDSCNIRGIVCLPNGWIVLIDENLVKVYDVDGRFLYQVVYPTILWGIAAVSHDTVAVTEGRVLTYLRLSINSWMKLGKRIRIDGMETAVSYAADTFAILCYPPPTVFILDQKGKMRKKIQLTQVKLNPVYFILLNEIASRFYICDKNNRCLICYSSQSTEMDVIWNCPLPTQPYSATIYSNNLIAFCNSSIHLITLDGTYLHQVNVLGKTFDVQFPKAVLQVQKHRVAVVSRKSNSIEIFSL